MARGEIGQEEADNIYAEAEWKYDIFGELQPSMPRFHDVYRTLAPSINAKLLAEAQSAKTQAGFEKKQAQAEFFNQFYQSQFAEQQATLGTTLTRQENKATQLQRQRDRSREPSLQQQFRAFEDIRSQRMGQLTGDVNWIERAKVKAIANPFSPQPESVQRQDKFAKWTKESEKYEDLAKAYKKALTMDMAEPFTGETLDDDTKNRMQTLVDYQKGAKERAENLNQIIKAEAATGVSDSPRVRTPVGPETPSFLQSAFPQLGENIDITQPVSLGAPSAQWWNRLLPSQQAKFTGLAGSLGTQSPSDLLAQTRLSLPEPRVVPRGRPARQRTGL